MEFSQVLFDQYQCKVNLTLKNIDNLARVSSVHRDSYDVVTTLGVKRALLRGVFLDTHKLADYPKVGDFVKFALETNNNEEKYIITDVLTRYGVIRRSDEKKEQIIAVNIDRVFVVFGLDKDVNFSFIDRVIYSVKSSGVEVVVVLNKVDKIANTAELISTINKHGFQYLLTSVISGAGISELRTLLKGSTSLFLGSSGVGKSSLINLISDSTIDQHVSEVREKDSKGRHTTTRRDLFVACGGVVVDVPGIREFGVYNQANEDSSFEDIIELTYQCKFSNCNHINNKGCKLLELVSLGQLDKSRYERYIKLSSEGKGV